MKKKFLFTLLFVFVVFFDVKSGRKKRENKLTVAASQKAEGKQLPAVFVPAYLTALCKKVREGKVDIKVLIAYLKREEVLKKTDPVPCISEQIIASEQKSVKEIECVKKVKARVKPKKRVRKIAKQCLAKKDQKIHVVRDYGLLQAVKDRDEQKVIEIFDEYSDDLSKNAVDHAFFKSMSAAHRPNLKPEIALLFLDNEEIKEMLSSRVLDRVFIKTLNRCLFDLFLRFLRDDDLREKLYVTQQTKKSFNNALRYLLKFRPSYLIDILSYPDLNEKLKNLHFIPKKFIQGRVKKKRLKQKKKSLRGRLSKTFALPPKKRYFS